MVSDADHRSKVGSAFAGPWPGPTLQVERLAASTDVAVLAQRISNASKLGPFVITAALGAAFQPAAWTRPALLERCSPRPGAPPPSPPWPTIAWAKPTAVGEQWAGLQFENGAALGVQDLHSLMLAQDEGRLRGVALFDSPANRTRCEPHLLLNDAAEEASDAEGRGVPDSLPAPRYFPRDFELHLGALEKDDPDFFVSKAGTRTHVHIDSGCTRFWMLSLHGRKLWRVFPPEEGANLSPAQRGAAARAQHFLADVLSPDVAMHKDLEAVKRVWEFELAPGELVLIPEGCESSSPARPGASSGGPLCVAKPPKDPARLSSRPF